MVEILYPSGRMTINLDNFFPTTTCDIKKLLKIIDMDWQHKEQIFQTIVSWINEEIKNSEETAKMYADWYMVIHPQVGEANNRVDASEIAVNKLKGTQAHKLAVKRLKEIKREYNHLRGLEISYNRSFKLYSGEVEKLKKNLVMFL
jgi:hypothetical protein